MEHSDLKNSYNQVGNKIYNLRDFEISNLKISTDLFKKSSLHIKSPVPKKLEVFALLSGLPFTKSFTESLVNVQKEISDIIENQYKRAIQIVKDNKDKLIILGELLLEKEVIFKKDLETIFGKRPFEVEKKETSEEIKVENSLETEE